MRPRAAGFLLAAAIAGGCGSGHPGPEDPTSRGFQPDDPAPAAPAPAGQTSRPAEESAVPPSRRPAPTPRQVGILLPGGGTLTVEVAADQESRRVGLMYRASLPARGGMLLVFPAPAVQAIWMKNCFIALDLLWLDGDGRVLAVQESAPPCAADPCPAWAPEVDALYVLELAAGTSAREGLRPGSTLQIISSAPLRGR